LKVKQYGRPNYLASLLAAFAKRLFARATLLGCTMPLFTALSIAEARAAPFFLSDSRSVLAAAFFASVLMHLAVAESARCRSADVFFG